MSASYLPKAELTAWLDKQSEKYRVFAPTQEGYAVVARVRTIGQDPVLERTRISPKEALIPASEDLIKFTAEKDPENMSKVQIKIQDMSELDAEPTIVFACRSCDARGMAALDKPYLDGPYKDPYYAKRKEQTIIISQTCNQPCPTCFCHWVGGSPDSPEGSDITFTEIGTGFVFTAHTDKGKALLEGMADAGDNLALAEKTREHAKTMQEQAPDISSAPARLAERFEDKEFWDDHTAKCLSCGACTYMCPTCQCFTITDEGDYANGRRLRSWDSCMSSRFTLEASGHNPRNLKAFRMRQRVSHKYNYSQRNHNMYSCTGCGRCVRYCPVSLDIREIVVKAVEK